jgi:predicted nucleic acid-binding protein
MTAAILDTDILSYILDQRFPEVVETSRQYLRIYRFFTISAISDEEVVSGYAKQGNVVRRERFLVQANGFDVIPFDRAEAEVAGDIVGALRRNGQAIGSLDPFIVATAIVNDRELVTNNSLHYQRIVDLGFPLRVSNWREG